MKATFVHKGQEIVMDLRGESWRQGQNLMGQLKWQAVSGSEDLKVYKALVNRKDLDELDLGKVLKKATSLFETSLGENGGERIQFKYGENEEISEKSKGPHLLFVNQEQQLIGHLDLPIVPHIVFTQLVESLETFHRFKVKSVKNNKWGVLFDLNPPSGAKSSLSNLKLYQKLDADILELKASITYDKLEYKESGVESVKKKLDKEFTSPLKKLMIDSNTPDNGAIKDFVDGVMEEVNSVKSF